MSADRQLGLSLSPEERRDEKLRQMEESELRRHFILKAREYAEKLWKARDRENTGPELTTITSDPVRRWLERVHSPPEGMSRNMMGSVFATDEWRAVGYTRSDLPQGNANTIRTWTWEGDQ